MKWSPVGAVWAEPSITGIGRLPMHVPLGRTQIVRLNGEWDFDLWDHPDQVPADVLSAGPASMAVTVPGNWTLQGTGDLPHYTNVQMPFADLPPQIPTRCPTGLYRRTVTIPEDFAGRRVVLRIEGAESVHLVFLDGHFIGYGTDSRLPSEYEISDYVRPCAEHHLAIFVLRYSAHSYIEDQDQWWMAGLHREVSIEARPVVHLCDLICTGDWEPATGLGRIEATAEVSFGDSAMPGHTVQIEVRDVTGTVISAASPQVVPHRARTPYVFAGHRVRADLQLGVVTPWSAEQPVRYQVVAVLRDADGVEIDQVATWTGCRRVEVRERQLLVNGQPIWIFGVNRHDHHPDRGKALTEQDLRDDLIAMRAHNITAIRTAHYPNHHRFYDLCDELGMYVIDEANIEGHAFNTSLCDDPRYLAAFMERGSRMVHRDRNHPSIIAWSLGNETGYGAHHDALAGWIRRRDPSRPLHYEGAIFHGEQQTSSRDRPPWAHGGRTATDIVCPMYPSIDAIRDYGASGDGDRPLIMCEYSHAMGNSNGSLAEYWEVIADTPGLQGGFIWEWKDHSLRDRDNASRLLHGGDFGDTPHDGNFVADGLLGADGDPHPALSEVAWVYRPVTVTAADNDQGSLRVRLTNRRFFTELTDLEARWEITVDGEHCAAGVWELPPLGPQVSVEHDLPESARVCVAKVSPEAEVVLTVTWHLRDEAWYAPGGHLEAWDQIVLQERRRPQKIASGASVASAPHLLKVEPWIWRAATDNDGFKLLPDLSERLGVGGRALSGWKAAGLPDRAASEVIEIHHVIEAAPDGGQIHRCRYVVTEEMADLPRLGLRCAIAAHFRQITWWGLGAGENYPDRAAGARRGIWTATPDPMPYLVPQEYGRRGETRWVRLCDPMSTGTAQVEVRAIEPAKLSFSVSPYSTEQLQRSANAADLVEEDVLWLHIDLHHRGVGTASCGPDVRPQYRIGPGEYEFAVWIGITEKR
jgi:beta-galactosidase